MNKFYTLLSCVMFLFITAYSQTISFCDDFESYTNGDPIAQTSKNWNTWGELMTGTVAPFADDANVVNTVPASSGSNTLYLVDATGTGGPQDIILMFDTTQNITTANITTLATPYISGDFTYSHMMYIRPGMTGYFNFQAENIPGNVWALEVNFDANGDILMSNTNGTSFTASYQQGVWFEIKFEVDLSSNNWEVFIDGILQSSFPKDGTGGNFLRGQDSDKLAIGNNAYNNEADADFHGYMDEFAVYNTAKYNPVVTGLGTATITPSYLPDPTGNHFTNNTGLTVTDQMLDTPENNFNTFNPLSDRTSYSGTGYLKEQKYFRWTPLDLKH